MKYMSSIVFLCSLLAVGLSSSNLANNEPAKAALAGLTNQNKDELYPKFYDHFISDAFGFLPAEHLSKEREVWAGRRLVHVLDPNDKSQNQERKTEQRTSSPSEILLFIGAKSLVAGQDIGHAVALTLDQYGNLIQDGSLDFRLGQDEQHVGETEQGIAHVLFSPKPKKGTYAGRAQLGPIQSARALYRVVEDLQSVRPAIASLEPLSPETFAVFTTLDLADKFGNPVSDGAGLRFHLAHSNGATSLLSAPVREARGEGSILVRDLSTGGTLNASFGTNTGQSQIQLTPLEKANPTPMTLWAIKDLKAIGIRLGPFTTSAGHLLNDGAPLTLDIISDDGKTGKTGWLLDGYFETILPLAPSNSLYQVTVMSALGQESGLVPLSEKPQKMWGAE